MRSNDSECENENGWGCAEWGAAPSVFPDSGTVFESPSRELLNKSTMKKYQCPSCPYIYDPAVGDPDNGIPAGTPFEELPYDWVCPLCGEAKEAFVPIEE